MAVPILHQQQPIEPTETIVPSLDELNLEPTSDEPVIRKARTVGLLEGLISLIPGFGLPGGFGGFSGFPGGFGGYGGYGGPRYPYYGK